MKYFNFAVNISHQFCHHRLSDYGKIQCAIGQGLKADHAAIVLKADHAAWVHYSPDWLISAWVAAYFKQLILLLNA